MRPWSPPRAACPRPSLPAGLEGPGLPKLRWPGQQVPVPPGPPERPRSPVAGFLLGPRETQKRKPPPATDSSADGGQRAPCPCPVSAVNTQGSQGLGALCGGLCSLPATRSGASGVSRPRTAHLPPEGCPRGRPGGTGRPCGRPACVAEQCSALSRVITASALGRQLGTGLRDVCE